MTVGLGNKWLMAKKSPVTNQLKDSKMAAVAQLLPPLVSTPPEQVILFTKLILRAPSLPHIHIHRVAMA